MVVLEVVFSIDFIEQPLHLRDHLWIVFVDRHLRQIVGERLDFLADRCDQDGMVSRHHSATFGHQVRMWDIFVLADGLHGVDDVVGKLLDGVVHRRFGARLRSIVIDTQSTTDVEKLDRITELVNFGIDPGRFLHGVLDPLDVGDLTTDVEVKQMEQVLFAVLGKEPQTF